MGQQFPAAACHAGSGARGSALGPRGAAAPASTSSARDAATRIGKTGNAKCPAYVDFAMQFARVFVGCAVDGDSVKVDLTLD